MEGKEPKMKGGDWGGGGKVPKKKVEIGEGEGQGT